MLTYDQQKLLINFLHFQRTNKPGQNKSKSLLRAFKKVQKTIFKILLGFMHFLDIDSHSKLL